MDVANQIILVAAALITFSIFAGVMSSRVGAPLLLVFLGLGMLAGEEGPGGIVFNDFKMAYLAGSIALALILFDGGLRTSREYMSLALGPAGVMATLGVVITVAIAGVAAHYLLGFIWPRAFLMAAIVGSTDAAAVFLLLHQRGLRLKPRVASALEVESGLNDPMAIFLTLGLVGLITSGITKTGLTMPLAVDLVFDFLWQLVGGLTFGVAGGLLVLRAVNKLSLSPGLSPVLAGALALVIFALAQSFQASGFLAIYLVGYILGTHPHRATGDINRFSDGVAWLAQISMFLMLGLLVTPSTLLPILVPGLGFAAVLIFIARPVAVWISLLPFGFNWRETSFISWIGLRGAVPIFLATIPVLENAAYAQLIFGLAYIVVLTSLVVQGWSISRAAKLARVELPARPKPRMRVELDLPTTKGRNVVAYTVDPLSLLARRNMKRLPLPQGTDFISVMRDGVVQNKLPADGLKPGDVVLLITSNATISSLDRLFGARAPRLVVKDPGQVDFMLESSANCGTVADMYGFLVTPHERSLTLAGLMISRCGERLPEGTRIRAGTIELVALDVVKGMPEQVGLDLDPVQDDDKTGRWRRFPRSVLQTLRETFLIDEPPK